MNLRIRSIEELRKSLKHKQYGDYFVLLNGGVRSSYVIDYLPNSDKFIVDSLAHGYTQKLSAKELGTKTNILEAMEKGAFYMEIHHEGGNE